MLVRVVHGMVVHFHCSHPLRSSSPFYHHITDAGECMHYHRSIEMENGYGKLNKIRPTKLLCYREVCIIIKSIHTISIFVFGLNYLRFPRDPFRVEDGLLRGKKIKSLLINY